MALAVFTTRRPVRHCESASGKVATCALSTRSRAARQVVLEGHTKSVDALTVFTDQATGGSPREP